MRAGEGTLFPVFPCVGSPRAFRAAQPMEMTRLTSGAVNIYLHVLEIWSGRRDLNPRPQPWQGCALPLSYTRSNPPVRGSSLNRGPPKRRRVLYRSIVFGMQQFLLRFRWKSACVRIYLKSGGHHGLKRREFPLKILFQLGFISLSRGWQPAGRPENNLFTFG
jgi:hypothetical protein